MDIIPAFIANTQSAKLMQPGKCAFDHPPENAQPTAVARSALGQNRTDAKLTQRLAMGLAVIGTVALNTIRPPARTPYLARDRRNRLDQRQQLRHVMPVGSGELHRERDSIGIGDNVMFRPQLPSIRRIRARFRPPKTARTEAESTTAREKSTLSFSRRRLSRMRCISSQTPAFCQSRSRRQQVMPEPQPISFGRDCQGMPVLSTKMMPVKALRSSTGGLPPLGRGGRWGMTGSMSFHNCSSISGLAMWGSSGTVDHTVSLSTHVLSDKPLIRV